MLSRSSAALLWLALPVMIAIGVGGGYLAAEAWAPGSPAPTAAVPAGGDHGGDHGGADGGDHGGTPAGDHGGADGGDHGGADGGDHGGAPAGDHGGAHGGDHGAAPIAPGTPAAGGHGDHGDQGGHDAAAKTASRPRAEVLTTFAAVNVVILAGALVLRRRTPGPRSGRRPGGDGAPERPYTPRLNPGRSTS